MILNLFQVWKSKKGTEEGIIVFLERNIDDLYLQKVKSLSLSEDIDKDINVVYTPLNGTGMVVCT